jgi:hypothetical protein
MRIFLGGEGPDDLGDWFRLPQHRANPPVVGMIEALLRKNGATDCDVAGARIWKSIKKFRFKPPVRGEVQNVLGLVLEADETGAKVLVFVRDQDGYPDREEDIEEGIRQARARSYGPEVVGGVAVQEIEAWVLAILGERRSEQHADAKAILAARHGIDSLSAKVAAIDAADLDRIPRDATSLRTWLERATLALSPKT